MRVACILVAALALSNSAYSKGISFPGRENCVSPKKSFKVSCRNDKSHEGACKLIIRDQKNGSERELFDGGRWCELLWQKDDSRIAITDWEGSNSSRILVFDAAKTDPAKDLSDIIDMKAVRTKVSEDESGGHCYWEALSWRSNGQLRFRIFGHTDTNPSREFSHVFLVDLLQGTVKPIK